ncbi:MAG: PEP-CTERM sorting domain-containing protein, partial [Tepidisphaerales bacterium]
DMLQNIGLTFNNIDGVPLGDKTVFVKYTRIGDASLDGYVTNADVTIVGTYYQGASPPVFANQSSAFAQAFMAGYESSHGGTSAVPEPGVLSLLGLGALALVRRRRRA